MTEAMVSAADLDRWATDTTGPVALCLRQTLLPVEGADGVIFPPTYADIGYNLDQLADGTSVVTIDSVASQANRMEPLFKVAPGAGRDAWLVPQMDIAVRREPCGECPACLAAEAGKAKKCLSPLTVKRSVLDFAHRAADAAVQSSGLGPRIQRAFDVLQRTGDAGPLCELAPTSLVFGVWDSRGGSGEKRPRLVRAMIRAWNVERLHGAAQFNSLWKALDEDQKSELEKAAKAAKVRLSESGFADSPAVFRKVGQAASKSLSQFRDGAPNPERRVLGGVLSHGPIVREVTVNLVALRGLHGANPPETDEIRRYLLSLALVAATADLDLFLREGCHLRYVGDDQWTAVARRGEPRLVAIDPTVVSAYAATAVQPFRTRWQAPFEYAFDLQVAKKLLSKQPEEQQDASEA